MGSTSGRGAVPVKAVRSRKPRLQGQSGGSLMAKERPLCHLLPVGSSGPRAVIVLGRTLDKAGALGLTRTGLPGLLVGARVSVSSGRATVVRVPRRGLGWAWTPGRASWRKKASCVWPTQEKGPREPPTQASVQWRWWGAPAHRGQGGGPRKRSWPGGRHQQAHSECGQEVGADPGS